MFSVLQAADHDGWRILAYVVVAGMALLAFRHERRCDHGAGAWPTFWLLSAGLLLVMAAGRAGHVGAWLVDLARHRAVDRGWYENRRSLQAAIVGLVGGGWLVTVVLECWRIPERRRRYLPASLAMTTLGAFAAVRIVSLHQIDRVLQHRFAVGMRIGTLMELALISIVAVVTIWSPLTSSAGHTVRASAAAQDD